MAEVETDEGCMATEVLKRGNRAQIDLGQALRARCDGDLPAFRSNIRAVIEQLEVLVKL